MAWSSFLTRHRWQKGLSVFLATMIWIAVRTGSGFGLIDGPQEQRVISQVPVAVLAGAGDIGAYRLTPPKVTVVLAAEPQNFKLLQAGQIEVFVSVLGEEPAGRRLPLHVTVPDGFRVVRLSPPEVVVERLEAPSLLH
jgi:hypothetical protein